MPALVPQLKSTMQYNLDLSHPSGQAPPIGQHLIGRWLKRNKDCRRVKQKPQEVARLACSTKAVYRAHFNELRKLMRDKSIQPADAYNMDKTGFRISIGGSQSVVTMD